MVSKTRKRSTTHRDLFIKHKGPQYTLRKASAFQRRKKNQKVLNQIPEKRDLKFIKIPKGTILYRTQPVKCRDILPKPDRDTGKTGVYFAIEKFIALGMILEYNKSMKLCKYVLNTDVYASMGKYSFRHLNPHRHLDRDFYPQGTDIPLLPEENVAHFDATVFPLSKELDGIHPLFDYNDVDYGAELFLADTTDVEYLKTEVFSVKKATKVLESHLKKNSKEYRDEQR